MKNSHGFLKSIIDKKLVYNLGKRINYFLDSEVKISNYYNEIQGNIPEVKNILNEKVFEKISEFISTAKPILKAIELHVQLANCGPIPPHQDNFYHCILPPNYGLKILVPIESLNALNGGLSFLDVPYNYKILKHTPSNIPNFSSIIPKKNFSNLKEMSTSYTYEIGDISYHFLNSIHYSQGNKTKERVSFLVYRFENPQATLNRDALEKYLICSKSHKKILEKMK